MSLFYSDSEVWEQMTSISASCVQKQAAVSYVISDSILKFSANELLVLDASISVRSVNTLREAVSVLSDASYVERRM